MLLKKQAIFSSCASRGFGLEFALRFVADAAQALVSKDSRITTGNFLIDDNVLRSEGFKDFSHCAIKPGVSIASELFTERTRTASRTTQQGD